MEVGLREVPGVLPVRWMCEALGISRAGFYAWLIAAAQLDGDGAGSMWQSYSTCSREHCRLVDERKHGHAARRRRDHGAVASR
jgi:hypothetical protein